MRELTIVIVALVVETTRDHQQYVLDHEQTLILHQTYCWSRKTLVTIQWMHFRLSGTCAKFFCLPKTNNRMLFSMGCFQRQRCHI